MRVKNIDTVTNIYQGQTLTASQEYTLQSNEVGKWSTDDSVLDDISNGKLQVGNDSEWLTGTSNQISELTGSQPKDSNGRNITRTAAAETGSTYLAHPIEIETSKLNGCFSSDHTGTPRTDFTMRFYNSSDVELVLGTQAELDSNCVKTVVTFKPQYDYEIMGGNIHQNSTPTTDVRIWVTGGMVDASDLPVSVKEFVTGLNLYYMGNNEQIETDGRASKFMKQVTTGAPYDTNTLQFIIRHNLGVNHKIMFVTEYFRV
jgi:hypothetical protein